jgi:NitT/TauT family transport system substrate-binding protein
MITRREFMRDAALLGAAGALGPVSKALAAEPPPETQRIRLPQGPAVCIAPLYIAEELLRGEGFSDVQYVKITTAMQLYTMLTSGETDVSMGYIAPFTTQVEEGKPIVMLAGIHPGCYELFATNGIRSVRELKGRVVSIPELNSTHQIYLSMVVSNIGIDPKKDIKWLVQSAAESVTQLAEGKIDALMAFAPLPQELRAKKIGQVILRSVSDKPWSQYFCCAVGANREFVKKHPVATKRALRAILKANSVCANEPEATARTLVSKGFTKSYDYALQTLKELPYARWRDFSTEDSVRFFALRLQEAGFIKSSPKKIIAEGTDWRFLNELKKELKA